MTQQTSFSAEEIQNFITMGKQLTSKAVLMLLVSVIGEGPDKAAGDLLSSEVKAVMPYEYSGYLQCEFTETPLKLNVSLSLVDSDYRTEIDIPDMQYANDLYGKYNFLKQAAAAYWRQFAEEHVDLYNRICKYRADVDFNTLVVDKSNPTVMYFDPQSKKRIGIFCYYVDSYGNPFYRKNNIKR